MFVVAIKSNPKYTEQSSNRQDVCLHSIHTHTHTQKSTLTKLVIWKTHMVQNSSTPVASVDTISHVCKAAMFLWYDMGKYSGVAPVWGTISTPVKRKLNAKRPE